MACRWSLLSTLKQKKVSLDPGKDDVSYETLVLAPGANPRRLPIPGANLDRVGVAPATEFLKGTLDLDRSGGVIVDELLRVNKLKDVYAIGTLRCILRTARIEGLNIGMSVN